MDQVFGIKYPLKLQVSWWIALSSTASGSLGSAAAVSQGSAAAGAGAASHGGGAKRAKEWINGG